MQELLKQLYYAARDGDEVALTAMFDLCEEHNLPVPGMGACPWCRWFRGNVNGMPQGPLDHMCAMDCAHHKTKALRKYLNNRNKHNGEQIRVGFTPTLSLRDYTAVGGVVHVKDSPDHPWRKTRRPKLSFEDHVNDYMSLHPSYDIQKGRVRDMLYPRKNYGMITEVQFRVITRYVYRGEYLITITQLS